MAKVAVIEIVTVAIPPTIIPQMDISQELKVVTGGPMIRVFKVKSSVTLWLMLTYSLK